MRIVKARNFTRGRTQKIRAIVIHTAECAETPNAAENVGAYFAGTQAPKASAHYGVDSDSTVQYVADTDTAWHAGPVNPWTIGIELAGQAGQSAADWLDVYSTSMLQNLAALVNDLCTVHGIPLVRLQGQAIKTEAGIFGHVDVSRAYGTIGGHWDPGPNFPWPDLFRRIDAIRLEIDIPITVPELVIVGRPWVDVVCNGQVWEVAPDYVYPVGIGEAETLALSAGCELPSPALVNAIWQAADLKIAPAPWPNPKTMLLPATDAWHAGKVQSAIAGRQYDLLAGTHKDVCRINGKIGLYGWHYLTGTPIQPPFCGHALTWRDYSQGLRLCRRKV